MILASVDIGSNASRLLIVKVTKDKNGLISKKVLNFLRVPTQLGLDVFNTSIISSEKEQKLFQTLDVFKRLSEIYEPEQFKIVATSALREASNGEAITEKIEKRLNFEIEVVEGEREAELVAKSYQMLNLPLNQQYEMFVDVGGGSTDIAIVQEHRVIKTFSYKIGAIKLASKFFEKHEWNAFKTGIENLAAEYKDVTLIGSGGNIRKLLKLYGQHQDRYISFDGMNKAYETLSALTIEERIKKFNLKEDRAYVIDQAALIFLLVMAAFNSKTISVPKIGLSDGVIFEMFNNLN
ncbi:MAG: Ppx/GppA family phosphatase [Bacteroidales bacterium]|nr:Ppx/GppA family phosphatase [Bacteroidales bacterium]